MTSSRIAVFNTLVLFSVRHIECFCTHRLSVTVAACLTFTHTHTPQSNHCCVKLITLSAGSAPAHSLLWKTMTAAVRRYTGSVIFVPMNCLYIWNTNSHHTLLISLKKTLQIWFKLRKSSSIMRLQHSQSGTRMHYWQILLLGGGMTIEFIEEEVKGGYSAFMLILAYIHFMLTHFPSKLCFHTSVL